jgi:hypothetical protein
LAGEPSGDKEATELVLAAVNQGTHGKLMYVGHPET